MRLVHLIAGARGHRPLAIDDADHRSLLEAVRVSLRAAVLAYCLMGTHLHVVARGQPEHLARWLTTALRTYARAFNRRHSLEGTLLRGPVEAIRIPGPDELVRTIRYVHDNPLKTDPPLAARAVEYPWSSRRAYFGLCRIGATNVPAAATILAGNAFARSLFEPWPALADLAPSTVPIASPATLLAASAQVFGCDPLAVAGSARGSAEIAARATYVKLGRLEAYTDAQLADALSRERSWVSRLGRADSEASAVQMGIELPENWLLPESREGAIEDPEREAWRQFADTSERALDSDPGDNPLSKALRKIIEEQ